MPPFSAETTRIVGVLSLVMPSELLVPVSLKDATLTDVGVVGAVVSITMDDVETTEKRSIESTAYA